MIGGLILARFKNLLTITVLLNEILLHSCDPSILLYPYSALYN